MTKKEIKGSILIAEYLGYKIMYGGNCTYIKNPNGSSNKLEEWAKYHCYLDWIFPVIEKIIDSISDQEGKHPKLKIRNRYCELQFAHYASISSPMSLNDESRVKCLFNCVAGFLEWFKEQKEF